MFTIYTKIMNELQKTTARMMEIETESMAYNEATNFGKNPNGKEAHIANILSEWDELKNKRNQLKYQS